MTETNAQMATAEDFSEVAHILTIPTDPRTLKMWNTHVRMKPKDFCARLMEGLPEDGHKITAEINEKTHLVVTSSITRDGKELYKLIFKAEPKAGASSFEYLRVAPSLQGHRIGRTACANMVDTLRAMKIRRHHIVAGLDNGAATWGKLGFVPTPTRWTSLQNNTVRPRFEMMKDSLPAADRKIMEEILANDDPKTIRLLSALKTPVPKVIPAGAYLTWNSSTSTMLLPDTSAETRQEIWEDIICSVKARLPGVRDQLPPQVVKEIETCLESKSFATYHKLANIENPVGGMPLGQVALVGGYWDGEYLDKDPDQRAVFEAYTGRKAPPEPVKAPKMRMVACHV